MKIKTRINKQFKNKQYQKSKKQNVKSFNIKLSFLALLIHCCTVEAATFTVTNTLPTGAGSLQAAIISANSNGSASNDIVFSPALAGQTITQSFTNPLPLINLNPTSAALKTSLSIDGSAAPGLMIDGGGHTAGVGSALFFVYGGNLTLSNLTLNNALSKGGDGIAGGGGALGAGGALFVPSGSNVTLTDVNLNNHQAQGGAGGSGAFDGTFMGGGGGGLLQGNGGNGAQTAGTTSGGGGGR